MVVKKKNAVRKQQITCVHVFHRDVFYEKLKNVRCEYDFEDFLHIPTLSTRDYGLLAYNTTLLLYPGRASWTP